MTPLAELIAEVSAGDKAAFTELYSRTHLFLYQIVYRIGARNDISADLVQEALLSVWQRAASFDPTKGTALGWLATIARNQAIGEARRRKRKPVQFLEFNFDPPAETFDPLASLHRRERLVAFMQSLSKLKRRERDLFLLAYYRGESRETLSKKFAIPTGTVKTDLRRAKAKLMKVLAV